jgi:serine/threonine protein kinase/tetratricopeptide (TPR) repeat protein
MGEMPHNIGPYRLLEPLGRGGMGVVYRAVHAESGRPVALKTVHAPDEWALSSLRREIHALFRIRHPQVVRILDEGVEQGLPWYAMELLEGTTLRSYAAGLFDKAEAPAWPVSKAPAPPDGLSEPEPGSFHWWTRSLAAAREDLPLEPAAGIDPDPIVPAAGGRLQDALTVVRRLCAPLAFLHGEGIVHRDLKPDNILIRAASGEQRAASSSKRGRSSLAARSSQLAAAGWPVLVDFGLMSQFGGPISREALEVRSATSGTAATMAPEQILGELVDARADLYALGCILYELITGRPPFLGASPSAMLYGHLKEPPAPPSRLASGVPPGLDELVLKLLAKQPRERLGHADDVAAALAELGAEDGVAAAGPKPRPYLYRPGFFGRRDVLGQLEQELRDLRAGRGALVLLGGESGVGKTRLVLELAREAERGGVRIVAGECLPGQVGSEDGFTGEFVPRASPVPRLPSFSESARAPRGRSDRSPSFTAAAGPLEALRKPLQVIADRCRERGEAETERLLGRRGKVLCPYEPSLSGLPGQAAYPEPAELSGDAARLRLFADLAETLAALAGAGATQEPPLLLVLDDLQWADELTSSFLDYLLHAGSLERMPLLVVATYRTEEAGPGLKPLLDPARAKVLELGRLDEAAVSSIVGDMLALPSPPAVFARYLARHSEGNPFFVAEVLRTAIAEGLLYRDGAGRWQVAEPSEEAASKSVYEALPLPASLQELVGRRIEGLGPEARRVVEVASVLGRELDAAVLQELTAGPGALYLEALQELLARHVLEEAAEGRLRFTHDKIREVAYERIQEPGRQELHRAAAQALETRLGAQRDEHLAVLARHWDRAGVPGKARDYFLAGARSARDRYAYGEAEELYRAYLRCPAGPGSENAGVRAELGREVLHPRGRNKEALAELRKALDEARATGDGPAEQASLLGLARVCNRTGQPDRAVASYEEALSLARTRGDRQAEGTSLSGMGMVHSQRGRFDRARDLFEQALDIAREREDRRTVGVLLGNLAKQDQDQGHLSKAEKLYEQALDLHRETGDQESECRNLNNLAVLEKERGRLSEARKLYERALASARKIGNRRMEGLVLGNLAVFVQGLGSMDEAQGMYTEAFAIYSQIADRQSEAIAKANLAALRIACGQIDEARALYDECLALSAELGTRRLEGLILTMRAALERQAGAPLKEARRLVGAAESALQGLGASVELALCLVERGHIALASGRSGRRWLKAAEKFAAELDLPPQSELGAALDRLGHAQTTFESGSRDRLFRGQHVEDLPPGLRRLIRRGSEGGRE